MSKIQFRKATEIPKGWGQETVIANNDKYCGKLLIYDKAEIESSSHFHIKKSETFFVFSGEFLFNMWDESGTKLATVIRVGDVIDIPAGCPHRVKCISPGTIFEVSTPHSDEDVIRIEPGESQLVKERETAESIKKIVKTLDDFQS